jgi:hypothetical protein
VRAAAQASDDAEDEATALLVKRVQAAHEALLAGGVKMYVA